MYRLRSNDNLEKATWKDYVIDDSELLDSNTGRESWEVHGDKSAWQRH